MVQPANNLNNSDDSEPPTHAEQQDYLNAGTIVEEDTNREPLLTLTPRPSQSSDESSYLGPGEIDMIERHGVSPSAFMYAVQEPCVFMQKIINISGATVIMDSKAEVVRAAIVCSTHLNM